MAETTRSSRHWSRSCVTGPARGSWTAERRSKRLGVTLKPRPRSSRRRGSPRPRVVPAAKPARAPSPPTSTLADVWVSSSRSTARLTSSHAMTTSSNSCRDLSMQVAGLAPKWVTIESIPSEALEAKKAELLADEALLKKPEESMEGARSKATSPSGTRTWCSTADLTAIPR